MEGVGMNSMALQEVELSDRRENIVETGVEIDLDDQTLQTHRLLLRLKFLACLMLAFCLFPLGVGSGTVLYSVPNLPGYLPSALFTGFMCLIHSGLAFTIVYEGRKITSGCQTTVLFRCLMKFLVATSLCTIITVIAYIGLAGILGIVECLVNSVRGTYVLLHRCGPHKNFFIILSLTNLATGCVLLTLVVCMSNVMFRKFVKIGLTSVSKSGQVYIRLNHITMPKLRGADI